ncbi:hypothetical protein P8Q88_00740 [Qipengyuania sp. XHP0207]|uniref:hypothetical protein n=1 Tax=Qipengyuania sp. XHP0207 TaxID=3038078 RepID=UPI00241D52E9|nr:hypothetical protein [Qipengyuania sp. XHP0207]MDG5746695.1 hypothetical protein [Qipengyuania sp. XHP0207]
MARWSDEMTGWNKEALRCIAVLAAASSTSIAASQPDPANDPIVVEGERGNDEAARKEARSAVRTSGAIRGDRPIARWRNSLCVSVIGIEEPARTMVMDRISAHARKLDLEIEDSSSCTTNVNIAFSFDAVRLVDATRSRRPRSFAEVPGFYEEVLFGESAPVRAWYRTGWRDRMGRQAIGQQPASVTMDSVSWSGMLPNKDDAPITTGQFSSRVQTDGTRAIEAAMIIVDRDLAAGYEVDLVADLIALHALAEIYPRDVARDSASILALFDAPADRKPRGMSECDWMLLQEIYALAPARAGSMHRQTLVRALSEAPDCGAGNSR